MESRTASDRKHLLPRLLMRLPKIAVFAAAACLSLWCAALLAFSPALPERANLPAALLMVLAFFFAFYRRRRGGFIFWALCAAAAVCAWARLEPRNDRDWAREVAAEPWAEIEGDTITLHNVRDFHYRSAEDFDERYVTKTVQLSRLNAVDLFVSYWSGKSIAHIMSSFGFTDGQHIAFSIEARKTKDEGYSTIGGFFRNYELIYIAAEERDAVALRTMFRSPPEQVYLLRGRFDPHKTPRFFLEYVRTLNELRRQPAFYNTLTTNCTSQVLLLARTVSKTLRPSWKLILTGYAPEYFYEQGSADRSVPLADLMERGLVNAKRQPLDDAVEYSRQIREGVPQPR